MCYVHSFTVKEIKLSFKIQVGLSLVKIGKRSESYKQAGESNEEEMRNGET